MHSLESLRDIRALEFALFGGLSQEEFYSRPRSPPPPLTGPVTGYAVMDLNTGEITCHSVRRKRYSGKNPNSSSEG
jgi:hypothetical protein